MSLTVPEGAVDFPEEIFLAVMPEGGRDRPRLADKLEFIDWDPSIKQAVLYKEEKKVRSIRDHQIVRVTRLRQTNILHNKCPTLCRDPSSI